MKTYQYHSAKLGCEVQVSYNKHGILCEFKTLVTDMEKHYSGEKEFKNFYHEEDFKAAALHHKLKIVEVARVVTFDMFWEEYKQKDCGRTKGELAWNKLSKTEQLEAFDFIKSFNSILKNSGTAKPYATTYLNSKRWIR